MKRWNALLGALLLLVLAVLAPARAERVERLEGYEIHYNAFPSSFLSPEVAQTYRLVRSRVQGVVTISVLRDGKAVRSRVAASATNEVGQLKPITLREVREADAIYYVGNVGASAGEVLRFTAEIVPDDTRKPMTLRFKQQFFGD